MFLILNTEQLQATTIVVFHVRLLYLQSSDISRVVRVRRREQ